MDYLDQFKNHIANQDYAAFLSLWEEYCSSDEVDPKELCDLLKNVKESSFKESFGRHVEEIIPLWDLLPPSESKEEVLRLIFDIQSTNSEALAEIAIKFLKERYGEDKYFNEKLKLIGLREKKEFQGALSHFQLLSHMKPANFVFHIGGWGVGEIMEVSMLREELILEFDYVAGPKDISFINAFKVLIPIPKDHFLARRFGNPDQLEQEAKQDPVHIIHLLLRDLGPKTAAEIKDELCDLIIPEKDWAKWWQNARTKIKKDTMIEVPENLNEPFRLRKEEISHEQRFKKALEKKPDVTTLIQTVYTFLRDFSTAIKNPEFIQSLKNQLSEVLSYEELTDAEELQIHFFLEDLGEGKEKTAVEELIKRFANIEDIASHIEIVAFKKRFLTNVRTFRSDWDEIFIHLFFKIDQAPIREYILEQLLEAKKESAFRKHFERIIQHPYEAPSALIWYFQKAMQKKSLPFTDTEGKNRLFEALLTALYFLEQSENKDLIKKIISILSNARYAIVRKIFQDANKDLVQEYLLLATKCRSLTDHDIKIFHSLAEVVHPSLSKLRKKYDEEELPKDVIWTTEEGFMKLKDRIHHLATVETVENAKEIEAARELGDLRENSEFKFALEKRDRLQAELKMLSDQLNKAQIIVPQEVTTEEVGIGNIVECIDQHNNPITYTLLGPWDADPDKNILSFQSKLAQSMAGLKKGDTFQFQDKELKITQIKNYFK